MTEIISRLGWADILIFVAILRGVWVGYKSGLFPELLRIVAYAVTVVITLYYYDTLAQQLTLRTFLNLTTATAIAFCALFLVVFGITKLISFLLIKILNVGKGNFLNGVCGALLGACRWVLLLSLMFMLIGYLPLAPLQKDIQERSVLAPKVSMLAPLLFDYATTLSPQLKK